MKKTYHRQRQAMGATQNANNWKGERDTKREHWHKVVLLLGYLEKETFKTG